MSNRKGNNDQSKPVRSAPTWAELTEKVSNPEAFGQYSDVIAMAWYVKPASVGRRTRRMISSPRCSASGSRSVRKRMLRNTR